MNTNDIIYAQCAKYPKLLTRDIVKALYQAEFGCGHLVSMSGDGLKRLKDELSGVTGGGEFIEEIGDNFCRAHLSGLGASGISPETLFKLFAISGREKCGDMTKFASELENIEVMAKNGEIPTDPAEARAFISAYRAEGCPMLSHSEEFRRAYAPAYRVISSKFARLERIFGEIDRLIADKQTVTIAIEGGSASGKTSLAKLLGEVYDANVFHMDDFFLQKHQRTPERFAEAGGNVDRERFNEEVLIPLKRGGAFSYRVFDCSVMELGGEVRVTPKKVNIVEGAYSTHPYFGDAYDFSIFLEIGEEKQRARILARNGEKMLERFVNEWIPLEHAFFEASGAKKRCSITQKYE